MMDIAQAKEQLTEQVIDKVMSLSVPSWVLYVVIGVVALAVVLVTIHLIKVYRGNYRVKDVKYRMITPIVTTHHCVMDNDTGISRETYAYINDTKWSYVHTDIGDDYIEINSDSKLTIKGVDDDMTVITDGCLIVKYTNPDDGKSKITVIEESLFNSLFERCF